MKFLVTGVAGFIGSFVAKRLIDEGYDVIGIDNLNEYYDVSLKLHRLSTFDKKSNFRFFQYDLADRNAIADLFNKEKFDRVIHLGAQAGVRYSILNPFSYVDSNLIGMMTILDGCRNNNVEHLVYASSSSVYGANEKIPFSETDQVDHPVSLYAATKKANELMAHSYSKIFGLPTTGLRFFTVYGPCGRPDMAPWLFVDSVLNKKPIKIFNNGKMSRDFTYIDDVVEGIIRVQNFVPRSSVPYEIFNIGNNNPVDLMDFIREIEIACGFSSEKIMMDMQPGDVEKTYADVSKLEKTIGYKPKIGIKEGVKNFVEWFREFKGI